MKIFAEELFTDQKEGNGKLKVSEGDTYFSMGADLFYEAIRNGFFSSFRGVRDEEGNLKSYPKSVKCADGKPLRGLNMLLVQQQAELFGFPASLDGNIYFDLDAAGKIRLSSAGSFGKYHNYRFTPVQNNIVPTNPQLGRKINFVIPDDFTAQEYLGKWIAASHTGCGFVSSDEKDRKAAKIILRELLRGKEENFVENAYQLGYDAEIESARILKSAVEKLGNMSKRKISYSEKEADFVFA